LFPYLLRKFLMAEASQLDGPVSNERERTCEDGFAKALVLIHPRLRRIEIGVLDLPPKDSRFQVGSLSGLSTFIVQALHFASP
jgi:hypothetical protein